MSATNATPLTAKLREATADLLWRQWRAIGGAAAGGPVRTQVDIEVLCLASLALDTVEPRLWVAMADWMRTGSNLVSVQRLKNLRDAFPGATPRLADLTQVAMLDAKDARWRTLGAGKAQKDASRRRPPARTRSAGPEIQSGAGLLLRMRAILGVSIKADLIALLLGSEARATVSSIAAALGYTTPAVFRAMQDLQSAGLLGTWAGPSATEYWVPPDGWRVLLGSRSAIAPWGHWLEHLSYVCDAIAWEDSVKLRKVSDYARAAGMRDVMAPHRAALARVLGMHNPIPDSADVKAWGEFHETLARQALAG